MTKKYRIKKEYLNESGCFARGGGVGVEDVMPDVDPELAQAPQIIQQMRMQAQQPAPAPFIPEAPAMPNSEQPQQMAMPAQAQMPADPYMQEAKIQGGIAREQASAYDQALKQQATLEADMAARTQRFTQQRDQVVNYLDSNPVDAERFYRSKSDLGKASTAIGLILGGLGAGLSGGPNVALDFLNKQIDNDIKSQIENRKSKETLLGQLEKQYGNETMAQQVLQSTLQTRLANQINKAALASGDKLAMARAQQVTAKLMADANAPMQAIAREQAIGDMLAAGQDPLAMGVQLDEKQMKRAVPGFGLANDPEVAKQLKQEYIPSYEAAKAGIQELQKFTIADKFNPVARSQAQAIQQRIIGQMRVALTGPGALTEGEREAMRAVVANPTDIFSIANSSKLDILQTALDKDMQARLKSAGLKSGQPKQEQAAPRIDFKPRK